MTPLLNFIVSAVAHLPKGALATVGRQVLASLAGSVESATSNQIVHQGEVYAFAELDAFLAKIEASAATTP